MRASASSRRFVNSCAENANCSAAWTLALNSRRCSIASSCVTSDGFSAVRASPLVVAGCLRLGVWAVNGRACVIPRELGPSVSGEVRRCPSCCWPTDVAVEAGTPVVGARWGAAAVSVDLDPPCGCGLKKFLKTLVVIFGAGACRRSLGAVVGVGAVRPGDPVLAGGTRC